MRREKKEWEQRKRDCTFWPVDERLGKKSKKEAPLNWGAVLEEREVLLISKQGAPAGWAKRRWPKEEDATRKGGA